MPTDPQDTAAPGTAEPAEKEAIAAQLAQEAADRATLSPLAPLKKPVFRMLWLTWLAANTCMWMNDVAAAWLMTTLTTSPMLVAANGATWRRPGGS